MFAAIAGAILIALELATGGFFLLWYGIGLLISGSIGWAIGNNDWVWHTVIGLSIGLVLMILFRRRFVHKNKHEPKDEFLLEEGTGEITENDMVNFRGTLWQYESNDSNAQFSVGEKVRVFPAKGNVVTIGKL
ncbi:MAG: hypothetical protein LBE89_08555, partial [Helicobacteraceae bacterium]|nr:hypothetical protein [Helicobacteraceae bacterium]